MTRAVVGIRREDKNEWERRVPLTPSAVAELVRLHDVDVVVQPSSNRCFPDADYVAAGATLSEDLGNTDIVFAVKEIPVSLFEPGGRYVFFSHTIKGQSYNMPMLRRLMELGCTLVDYETITRDDGRRLVFFGRHAGLAGMIDTLWALGQRLRWMGHETLFAQVEAAHRYPSLADAERALAALGTSLADTPLPSSLAPFICGVTGYGNVSQGAQHILDLFPVEEIPPDDLPRLVADRRPPRDRIFKTVFGEEDLVEPRVVGESFVLEDYYERPERYRSVFYRHARSLSVLVNGVFWTDRYPRLLSQADLRDLFADDPPRLLAVGDVSCDIDGSLACTVKATEPDEPVYMYDPATGTARDGWEGDGLLVMAVDNLPCELPREASETFSEALLPFVPALARLDTTVELDALDLPDPVKRAVILMNGELTANYAYLQSHLD